MIEVAEQHILVVPWLLDNCDVVVSQAQPSCYADSAEGGLPEGGPHSCAGRGPVATWHLQSCLLHSQGL